VFTQILRKPDVSGRNGPQEAADKAAGKPRRQVRQVKLLNAAENKIGVQMIGSDALRAQIGIPDLFSAHKTGKKQKWDL
jgi:hypothetical protein